MEKSRGKTKGRGRQPRQVFVRLSDEHYERLSELAERERRSLNAQAGLFIERGLEECAA